MGLQTKKIQVKKSSKNINKTVTVEHSEVANNLSDINSAKIRVRQGFGAKANLDCLWRASDDARSIAKNLAGMEERASLKLARLRY